MTGVRRPQARTEKVTLKSRGHVVGRAGKGRRKTAEAPGVRKSLNLAARRKKVEEELAKSNQRLAQVLESIQDDFYVLDRNWNFAYVSRQFASRIGKEPADFIGKNIWTVFPKHAGTIFEQNLRATMERREVRRFEVGGKYTNAWYSMASFPSSEGVTVLGTDVTKGKQAEESLRRLNAELEQRVAERTSELQSASLNLQAERQRFLGVLETLPVMITLIRPDYHVPFANRAYREALGEANGRRCFEYQFGREKPCEECQAFTPLKTGRPHNWEWTLPNGRTFDIHNFPFVDADGSPMILEMDVDVTERRRAEALVNAERQRLYDVLDTLAVYVILLTEDYHVQFANRFFEERFGDSEGRRCYEYLFRRNEPCDNCETYTVLRTGSPHHWYWTGPDGRDYDIYDFPFNDTDGSRMILELGIDITERRKAESALREAGAYNRSLIEASIDPLVTIGPDGRITDVNAATEKATGFGRSELSGTDFCDYFTDPERARIGYQQVFREGTVQDYPLEIRHRDGHTTPVLYNAAVYRHGNGEVAGVFAAARDVTERRRMEAALKVAYETLERRVAERTAELARSNKDLEQFAYLASHDLQEPLRQVTGFGDLMRQRYLDKLDDRGQQYMAFMIEGAQRMSALVRALLDYSRVGRSDRKAAPVSAESVLGSVLLDLRTAVEESSASIERDPLPMVMADPVELGQVFQNLIGNALKFRREDVRPEIHIGCRQDPGTCTFWVKDNGIGIMPDLHEKAFAIFQRLHGQGKYPGTGIGLAICKKIVERFGGRIWIESTGGKGSTFFFTLPAARESQA